MFFLGPDLPCKVLSCDLKLSQTDDRRIPSLICTLQVVCSIHCIVYTVAPPINCGPVCLVLFAADEILRTLGEGTFGKVVCCEDR